MKRFLLKCNYAFFAFACLFSLQFLPVSHGYAQTTVQIGTGGDTSIISCYSPINRGGSSILYSRANFVVLPSELAAAGVPVGATISKLAFNKGGNPTDPGEFAIWMNNSSLTPPLSTSTTWASITASHTKVYENLSQSLPGAIGWVEFVLTTPFTWTGGSLEIATDWYVGTGSAYYGTVRWETDIAYATYIVGNIGQTAGSPPATLNGAAATYKRRPNVQITYTAVPCTAPPTAGTANASVSTTCPSTNFTLSLSGNSSGAGLSFQWQESTDNNTWTNIPGATSSIVTVSQTANRYYRAIATCSGQSDTTHNTLLVNTFAPLSGVYTINSGSATGGTNFQTFAELADRLNCAGISGPVTVNVQPGTYTGRFVLNVIGGVSSVNTITINGNGQTLTYNSTLSLERSAIQLYGTKYVTINGLIINVANGTYGWGIHLSGKSENITIINNTIISDTAGSVSQNYACIVASGSPSSPTTAGDNANNVTITGNILKGGYYGAVMVGNGAALATGNIISNNTIENFGQEGILLNDQGGAQILNNNISRPTRAVLNFFRGIYLSGTTSQGNLIKNNRIHDSQTGNTSYTGIAYGIYITGVDAPNGSENKVINNLIYKFNGEGDQYGIYNSSSDGNFIYHNTIVLNDQAASAGNVRAIYQVTAASNVEVKNNIVYVSRNGSGTKVALFYSAAASSSINSDNNIIYVPASANFYVGSYGSNAAALKTTLADWQSAGAGYDGNTIATDPIFANAATHNYQPTNSLVNNTGTNVGVTDDIFGTARNAATPDAGAIEWSPSADDAALTAFIAPATAPYCSSTLPVIFTLTNAGTAILNTATINWTVNGVAQSPYNATALNLSPGNSVNITLSNYAVSANTLYVFSATVSNPNGNTDQNAANNTFTSNPWRTSLSGTFTVNKSLPASSTNYTSIQAIADDLKNGGICGSVTVNVVSGTGPYTEQVTIDSIPGASLTDTIVFNGNGNVLQFTPTSAAKHVLLIKRAKYVVVKNFEITSLSPNYGYGINIIDRASKIAIRNNIVNVSITETSATNCMGITTAGSSSYLTGTTPSDSLEIFGNVINGGGIGIEIVGNFALAQRNTNIAILNNTIKDSYSEGILFLGAMNVLVSGNEIYRPNRTTSGTFTGIYFYNAIEGYLIEKNRIHDISNAGMTGTINATGIYVLGNTTWNASGGITNNIIYNFKNNGYQYGINDNMSSAATIAIYHNTILFDDATYTGSSATYAYYNSASSAATTAHALKNNIFSISRGGTGIKVLEYISSSANGSFVDADYNVLHLNSSTGTYYIGKVNTNNYQLLLDWRNVGKEPNGTDADPVFTNAAAGNLTPTNAAVDGATMNTISYGVATDILGTARGANPDAGAFEFGAPMPVTLLNFTGEKQGAINRLQWTTATEVNNAGFEVQRSADGKNFTRMAFIASKEENGNSNQMLAYQYYDERPLASNNYYRLRQVDKDGKSQYSSIVLVKGNKTNEMLISNLYPNPAKEDLNLIVTSPFAGKANIIVTDITGQILLQRNVLLQQGDNVQSIAVSALSPGMYILKIVHTNGRETTAQKFIKQ